MKENWGRWGPDDEMGSANLIGSEQVLSAASLVAQGLVIPLGQPLGRGTPTPHHRVRPAHFMDRTWADAKPGAEFAFADDTLLVAPHTGTHIDALAHVWSEDNLYNGFPASGVSSRGARRCDIASLPPLVGRGVLLDLVQYLGPLAAGREVTASELEATAKSQGLEILPGDLVLLRTGWWASAGTTEHYFSGEPGPGEEGAIWLAELDVALVGADNYAFEVQPNASSFPAHVRLLRDFGIPILEGLDVERLADQGVNTFLLMASALPIVGGTGSPVNPVAVL